MSNVESSKDPDYFYKDVQLHIKSPRKLPYYIISIGEERASAVQNIHQQISSSINISLSGVNGYDKKSSDKFFKKFPTVRNELNRPGEFGCFASHYAFWKYVADNELEGAVVFEDDAFVHGDFVYMYKLALKSIPNTYDVFSMYVDKDQYGRYNTGEFVNETVARGYQDWSTLCYFISSKGARKLIQLVEESGMNQPVDWFLFRHGHAGRLEVYTWPPAINPPVSINKELVPQIKR
jgi:GR25 family glycosyltransferase involved in LPS biosynthesis